MLDVLVGLIERWWKDKPRTDVVRAVVRLRSDMETCEKAYASATADDGKCTNEKQLLYSAWRECVDAISTSLDNLNEVLQIFDHGVYGKVRFYVDDEAATVKLLAQSQKGATLISLDAPGNPSDSTFKETRDALDAFIKANFKVEEIHSAHEFLR